MTVLQFWSIIASSELFITSKDVSQDFIISRYAQQELDFFRQALKKSFFIGYWLTILASFGFSSCTIPLQSFSIFSLILGIISAFCCTLVLITSVLYWTCLMRSSVSYIRFPRSIAVPYSAYIVIVARIAPTMIQEVTNIMRVRYPFLSSSCGISLNVSAENTFGVGSWVVIGLLKIMKITLKLGYPVL